jgi:hypothetical protein
LEKDVATLNLKMRMQVGTHPEVVEFLPHPIDEVIPFFLFLKAISTIRNYEGEPLKATTPSAAWATYQRQINAGIKRAEESMPADAEVGIGDVFKGLTGMVLAKARGKSPDQNWDE